MSDAIINADTASFATEVLDRSKEQPVLVDFWAEWCGPCKAVAPILEELATTYADKAKIVKVDVDANGEVAANYGVSGIPTVIIFKDGQEVARRVGAVTLDEYTKMLDEQLG